MRRSSRSRDTRRDRTNLGTRVRGRVRSEWSRERWLKAFAFAFAVASVAFASLARSRSRVRASTRGDEEKMTNNAGRVQVRESSTAWRECANAFGAKFLSEERNRCAFERSTTGTFANEGRKPRLVERATTATLRMAFEKDALLRRSGEKMVQHAHPAYHVVAGGSVERTVSLREFTERYLSADDVANVSFVFDSMSDVLNDRGLISKTTGKSIVPRRLARAVDADRGVIPVLSIGGDGAGLSMHQHDATLLTLLHGYKLWIVASPEVVMPDFVFDSTHAYGYMLLEEMLKHRDDPSMRDVMWCVQPPNTAVYLPGHWWHATVNLGEAVAFAEQLEGGFTPTPFGAAKQQKGRQRALTLAGHSRDYMFKGDLSRAIDTALEALEADPLQVMAFFTLTESYAGKKDGVRAVKAMTDAAEAVRELARRAKTPAPELYADSLLRIAYTLCDPLSTLASDAVKHGIAIIREALEAAPTSLENNILREALKKCAQSADE